MHKVISGMLVGLCLSTVLFADQSADDSANKTPNPPEQATADELAEAKIQGITFAHPVDVKWKVGVRIIGGSSTARNVLLTLPVPNNWPEQRVSMADEDIPPGVSNVKFRDLESGVKQLVITMASLRPREDITLTTTFLVSTSQIIAPPDTSIFERPRSSHREGKLYTGISPDINYRDSRLRKQVKEIVADKQTVWDEVEAMFDWIRENITQQDSEPTNVASVFKNRAGCSEDIVGLFVGMCRANKIPARIVWVEGTYHAEFMLVDSQSNAHWFPCSVIGIREFGSLADPRLILQKGDSIRVPEKESRQKYVREFLSCSGKSRPAVAFIRELLPADD